VFNRVGIQGLRGLRQSEQFMNLEAIRSVRKEFLKLRCCFGKPSGLVLGDSRAILAVQF